MDLFYNLFEVVSINGVIRIQSTEDYSKLLSSYILPLMIKHANSKIKNISESFINYLMELVRIASADWKKLTTLIIKPIEVLELLNKAFNRFKNKKTFIIGYINFAKILLKIDESLLVKDKKIMKNIWDILIKTKKKARLLHSSCIDFFVKVANNKGELLLKIGRQYKKSIYKTGLHKEKVFEFFLNAYESLKKNGIGNDLNSEFEYMESNSSFQGLNSADENSSGMIDIHEGSLSPPHQDKQYEEILSPTSEKKNKSLLNKIHRKTSFESDKKDPEIIEMKKSYSENKQASIQLEDDAIDLVDDEDYKEIKKRRAKRKNNSESDNGEKDPLTKRSFRLFSED